VGKFGGVVPAKFLSGKNFDAAQLKQLGELGAEAKGVGQPGNGADLTEFFLTIALAVENLAGDGFATDDIQFWFHP
jgi:hypothetical protein